MVDHMRRATSRTTIAAAALLAVLVSAAVARADTSLCVHATTPTPESRSSAVEFLARVGKRIYVNPNFEYVFSDDPPT